jgi:DNA-binding XRE family transcriptional regulator
VLLRLRRRQYRWVSSAVVTMFAELLRHDRERHGLSVEQAARRVGVPPVAYAKFEAGERWPSWETYDRIAAAFGWPRTFA